MRNIMKMALGAMATLAVAASPVEAKNPYTRANNSFISINGTVDSVSADKFMLNYGDGLVTVEMDDYDRDADGYNLMKGDKVRVSGFIDDDVFETTKIEAGSVFVENLGTYFFASSADEEDSFMTMTAPVVVSSTYVQGKVTGINGCKFTLDTGKRMLTVDTSELGYNPLDKEGYQKIKKGDRVSVGGKMDKDFWGNRELDANSVITLMTPKQNKNASNKQNQNKTSNTASASDATKRNATTK